MQKLETLGKDKLNIGSGKSYYKDFLNVDINAQFTPDILVDILEADFPKESFKEVLAIDVLNNFTEPKTRRLLRYIFKWLKHEGTLTIHMPNLDYLVEILHKSQDSAMRHEALKWLFATDGTGSTNYPSNQFKWCYNPKEITAMLSTLGYVGIKVSLDCMGFGMMVEAWKQ